MVSGVLKDKSYKKGYLLQDLDGDGVWEIPDISGMYERLEGGQVVLSDTFYLITWCRYDINGGRHVLCSTYYNSSDGWYLVIPNSWRNRIALARSDYSEGVTVERSIQFYVLKQVDSTAESTLEESETLGASVLTNTTAELFMTICKNTGTDRLTRSVQGGRTVLNTSAEDTVYSVRLEEDNWFHWTPEKVQQALHIITTNWFND